MGGALRRENSPRLRTRAIIPVLARGSNANPQRLLTPELVLEELGHQTLLDWTLSVIEKSGVIDQTLVLTTSPAVSESSLSKGVEVRFFESGELDGVKNSSGEAVSRVLRENRSAAPDDFVTVVLPPEYPFRSAQSIVRGVDTCMRSLSAVMVQPVRKVDMSFCLKRSEEGWYPFEREEKFILLHSFAGFSVLPPTGEAAHQVFLDFIERSLFDEVRGVSSLSPQYLLEQYRDCYSQGLSEFGEHFLTIFPQRLAVKIVVPVSDYLSSVNVVDKRSLQEANAAVSLASERLSNENRADQTLSENESMSVGVSACDEDGEVYYLRLDRLPAPAALRKQIDAIPELRSKDVVLNHQSFSVSGARILSSRGVKQCPTCIVGSREIEVEQSRVLFRLRGGVEILQDERRAEITDCDGGFEISIRGSVFQVSWIEPLEEGDVLRLLFCTYDQVLLEQVSFRYRSEGWRVLRRENLFGNTLVSSVVTDACSVSFEVKQSRCRLFGYWLRSECFQDAEPASLVNLDEVLGGEELLQVWTGEAYLPAVVSSLDRWETQMSSAIDQAS